MVGPSNIRAMLHTVHILGVKRQWGGGRAVVRPCIRPCCESRCQATEILTGLA